MLKNGRQIQRQKVRAAGKKRESIWPAAGCLSVLRPKPPRPQTELELSYCWWVNGVIPPALSRGPVFRFVHHVRVWGTLRFSERQQNGSDARAGVP